MRLRQVPDLAAAAAPAVSACVLLAVRVLRRLGSIDYKALVDDPHRLLHVILRHARVRPALHGRQRRGRHLWRGHRRDLMVANAGELRTEMPGVHVLLVHGRAHAPRPEHVDGAAALHQHPMRRGRFGAVQRQVLQHHHVGRRRPARGVDRERYRGRGEDGVGVSVVKRGIDEGQLQQEVREAPAGARNAVPGEPRAQRLQEVLGRGRTHDEAQLLQHEKLRRQHLIERHLVTAQVHDYLTQGHLRVHWRAGLQRHADRSEELPLRGSSKHVLPGKTSVVAVQQQLCVEEQVVSEVHDVERLH
mmetsp:Transcript_104357/g.331967  ORF Transcript_104357/g.331967 Transcript_104357/m.331967 type:complete len:303 (+) Transcript_104357:527-1435(+)